MTPIEPDTAGGGRGRFRFGDDVPIGSVPAGTSLLVEGSGPSGARDLLYSLLVDGREPTEGSVLLSTDEPPSRVERSLGGPPVRFGMVACGPGEDCSLDDPLPATSVSSPADLTGLGIRYLKVADAVTPAGGVTRVGLDSLSTLLMYVDDTRSGFRFLHAFTGRVRSGGGLGLFLLDTGTLDDRTASILRQPVDGRIEVRDDGGRQLRVSGLDSGPAEWTRF